MNEFFTQCMKDLYALTGIEQVRWMQNDLKDGKRNFDLCVEGMAQVSKQFAYIPEDEQKKIVRRMMVEDKDYTGLNSRVVYKWLALFKDVYWSDQTHYQEGRKLTYGEYLNRCLKDNIPPLAETEWDKPVSNDQFQKFLDELNGKIMNKPVREGGILDPHVELLKEQLTVTQTPEQKKLRAEYLQANYNPDGTRKECWTEFEDWFELTTPKP